MVTWQEIQIPLAVFVSASVIIGAIVHLFQKLRKDLVDKTILVEKNKEELSVIKHDIVRLDNELTKQQVKIADQDENIHCLKDEVAKSIGDVRESLARLEGSLDKVKVSRRKSSAV